MKLAEFSIIQYGPLPDLGRIKLGALNLFIGRNEDGKTLTIDALAKILLGKNIHNFENINRVEGNPEGFAIIIDDHGEEVKLPEKGDLQKVTGLTASQCQNIFIVRNSNLAIVHESAQEGDFYTKVMDRLTGLRTNEISTVKKALKDLGKLTRADSGADLSDNQIYGKIKSRIDEASKLEEVISRLNEKIKEEGLGDLEIKLAELQEKTEGIEQQLEELSDARKREKFEKGQEALQNLKDSRGKLVDLKCYNDNDKDSWRDCERDLESRGSEKEKILGELIENGEELKEITENIDSAQVSFKILMDRKGKVDDEIKPELNACKSMREELEHKGERARFFAVLGIISSMVFGISLFGIIFRPSAILYLMGAISGILAIVSGVVKLQFAVCKGKLASLFEKVRLSISKLEMDAGSIDWLGDGV